MNKNIILYSSILIFGVLAPFMLPAFKVQLSILCILIVLARTINIHRIDNWTLKAGSINGASTPKINIDEYKIIFLFIILDTLFF